MPASTNASYVGRFAPPGRPNTTSTPSAFRHSITASTARMRSPPFRRDSGMTEAAASAAAPDSTARIERLSRAGAVLAQRDDLAALGGPRDDLDADDALGQPAQVHARAPGAAVAHVHHAAAVDEHRHALDAVAARAVHLDREVAPALARARRER